MTQSKAFNHSTPELYDRYMGPLLFEPYAKLLAERSARLRPTRILETAAGTGIVTRALSEAVPRAQIVATDLNPVMIEFATQRMRSQQDDLMAAGFTDIQLETVALSSRISASDAAQGLVLGSPFRAEIERRDPSALDRAVNAVTEALRPWDGRDVSISAHVVTARAASSPPVS